MTVFIAPLTVADACAALAADEYGSKAIAGGTALVLMMGQGLVQPDTLVSLAGLAELRGIEVTGSTLRLGALSTLTEVAGSPSVRHHAPSLAHACAVVGNVRVRNMATIGGNVAEADYASDPPSVLVGLDAVCRIDGPGGIRMAPVSEIIAGFYTTTLEPGEIITEVRVPVAPEGLERRSTYVKYISRSSEDRPCVGVAASVDLVAGEVRRLSVVVGAVADVPQRFDAVTEAAIGSRLGPDVVSTIASAYASSIDAMEDARGSAWYRSQMIDVHVRRALTELVEP